MSLHVILCCVNYVIHIIFIFFFRLLLLTLHFPQFGLDPRKANKMAATAKPTVETNLELTWKKEFKKGHNGLVWKSLNTKVWILRKCLVKPCEYETKERISTHFWRCPIFYQKKMCNTWFKYNLKNIVIPLSLLKKVNLIHLYLMFL